MTKNKKELIEFLEQFNYVNHNWNNIPNGFPNCKVNELSKKEKSIYDGIKMAWLLDSEDNYELLGKTFILNKDLFLVVGTGAMKTLLSLTSLSIITFILLSVIYYINVRFNLGLSFLYNVFS